MHVTPLLSIRKGERKMKRKLLTIALLLFLTLPIAMSVLPRASAEHFPNVYWTATETTSMYVSGITWPSWFAAFTVENVNEDVEVQHAIITIKFVIPRDLDTDLVLFHFTQSRQPDGWTGTPDEFDASGWPGVIIFNARDVEAYIGRGQSADFEIQFESGPSVCNYRFAVYTVDEIEATKLSWLYLTIDDNAPTVTLIAPPETTEENPIIAVWDPYPINHYLVITVTAEDTGTHDTGITRIEIWIDGSEVPNYVFYPEDFPIGFPEVPITFRHYGLGEGGHIITAVAYDGAMNPGYDEAVFWYHIPRLFVLSPDSGSVGPTNTHNIITDIWSGSQVTFGGETFGTLVTATGLAPAPPLSRGFTPNSHVDIMVVHSTLGTIYVAKNIPTGQHGEFQVQFLFPTTYYGMYKVIASDRGGVTDYAFFEVVPKIAYNPPIVVGPHVIEAFATGLAGNGEVAYFMVDGTDALATVNMHAVYNWYSDELGNLYTNIASAPGFAFPVLQNGAYQVTLGIYGWYWDGFEGESIGETYHEVTDTVQVANDFQALLDAMANVEDGINSIRPTIVRIDENVVDILTEVGAIETKLDDIKPRVADIQGRVVTIQTIVGQIKGNVTSIKGDTVTIITNQGTITTKLDSIISALGAKAAQTTADDILNKLVDIPTPLTINIATVMATIAAIASIIAVIVVVTRLKVAGA
jgi:archaellum component FlaC